jgi:hypothetical protein
MRALARILCLLAAASGATSERARGRASRGRKVLPVAFVPMTGRTQQGRPATTDDWNGEPVSASNDVAKLAATGACEAYFFEGRGA